jgi:hypothetical protein
MARRNIRMHHANFPRTREPPPHFMRDASSNSPPRVSANNKELRHIPDNFISHSSDPLFTNTNCQSARHCDQKRMSVRLARVKGKALVSKPAIRSKIQILEFTEVLPVQLKQVSQDRLLLWSSGGTFDMRGCLSCGFCRSRNVIRRAKINSRTIVVVVFVMPLTVEMG